MHGRKRQHPIEGTIKCILFGRLGLWWTGVGGQDNCMFHLSGMPDWSCLFCGAMDKLRVDLGG